MQWRQIDPSAGIARLDPPVNFERQHAQRVARFPVEPDEAVDAKTAPMVTIGIHVAVLS